MLKSVIDHFADHVQLPIEIDEIADVIINGGWQDEIYFIPIDCDPAEIRGVYTQFRYTNGVYGDSQWVTQIAYSQNVPQDWQRIICAKEMIHIFDSEETLTDTPEEVDGLLEKLVGPLSSEDYGISDLSAAKDRIALYQALPLLFPRASLEEARILIDNSSVTLEEVADWAKIPLVFVQLMLTEEWLKHVTMLESA